MLIHFWSATCPFVLRYEERLQALAGDYKDKAAVLAVDSNFNETPEQIRKEAQKRKLNYPVLIDKGHQVADQFGAITTPHVYVLTADGKLAYEGSVDDQGWSEKDPVNRGYAQEALDAVLAGEPVKDSKTDTFGCTIKRA